jgi:hypothetical protein
MIKKKFLKNIVVKFYNIFILGFNRHNCQKKISNSQRKIIFDERCRFIGISFYCNIFLSQNCVQKYCVCKLGLKRSKMWKEGYDSKKLNTICVKGPSKHKVKEIELYYSNNLSCLMFTRTLTR